MGGHSSCMRSSRPPAAADTCKPSPVTLQVYDVGTRDKTHTLNQFLGKFGTGVFHCGVEVYGREWSFQMTKGGTGIFNCQPMACESHTFRESVPMGSTKLTDAEVFRLVEHMRKDWSGKSYDILERNCCHACQELCTRLGVGSIPWRVMNLAGAGATVRSVVSAMHPMSAMHLCSGPTKVTGSQAAAGAAALEASKSAVRARNWRTEQATGSQAAAGPAALEEAKSKVRSRNWRTGQAKPRPISDEPHVSREWMRVVRTSPMTDSLGQRPRPD